MTSVVFGLLLTVLNAAPDPAAEAWQAWLAGDFVRVERLAALSSADTALTSQQRARVGLALGCSEAMRGREAAATSAFGGALELDAFEGLTQADLPPPAWRLFEPLRAKRLRELNAASSPSLPMAPYQAAALSAAPDTVRLYQPLYHRRSAAVQSLVFPGWGHLAEKRSRGWLLAASEAAALAGFVWSFTAAGSARDDYLNARGDAIDDRYDRYNRYYRLTWGFGIASAAIYLYTQADFFIAPPPQFSIISGSDFALLTWRTRL